MLTSCLLGLPNQGSASLCKACCCTATAAVWKTADECVFVCHHGSDCPSPLLCFAVLPYSCELVVYLFALVMLCHAIRWLLVICWVLQP
jgi:hypothetical protein